MNYRCRPMSEKTKRKISKALRGRPSSLRGKKSHLWRGGITPLVMQIRQSAEYKKWHREILFRDNFICCVCGLRGGRLHVHHVLKFSQIIRKNKIRTMEDALKCVELWDMANGITMCVECHCKKHNLSPELFKRRRISKKHINMMVIV